MAGSCRANRKSFKRSSRCICAFQTCRFRKIHLANKRSRRKRNRELEGTSNVWNVIQESKPRGIKESKTATANSRSAVSEDRLRLRIIPNSRRTSQMPSYNTVPDYLVDRHARDLADLTLRIVCENLKIKP